ncbi:MAG: hypothetical protein M9958_00945 [Chitinophagales bacterium]|nr:hypothetical protein [Chitinophagales bacterium]
MNLKEIDKVFKFGLDFFFGENFPAISLIVWLFPLMLLMVVFILKLDLYFQKKYDWQVGYTRKFFHFSIFVLAGVNQYIFGISGVFVLGWAVTLVIGYLLWKGKYSVYYWLLARAKDAPHPSRYIVYPYVATFIGGVLNNLFFPSMAAIAGYLIAGFGDAIGEPVGSRWGRHRYLVFNWFSEVKSYRSLEGSFAVFIVSALAFYLSLIVYGYPTDMLKIIIAAIVAAIVEGLSPHGWDNLSSQVCGAILMSYFLI